MVFINKITLHRRFIHKNGHISDPLTDNSARHFFNHDINRITDDDIDHIIYDSSDCINIASLL
ncbi:hypothetical protein E2562_034466 [Oryza meyeriana var. granulata]|uniref:Uncharacterized protein n=1 Tax=Oryza meyeriana var. granulata TaxID=110450 RepID=A0A6G1CWB3_9ORYZ|nr:hypothetical protein E2562_034466 [Oryza meyeriana var. granulata]